jgi:hypothetical protein
VFLQGAPQFSLVAFVAPVPRTSYEDAGLTNEWTPNNTYFPQGTNQGYFFIGTNGQFLVTNYSGELWLGFNDDAETLTTNDNSGAVSGYLHIDHHQ